MVLPIDPTNIPLGPSGIPNISQSPGHAPITARQIQSFSGLPPSDEYIPKIYSPAKISIQEFSMIVANSVDRLREILYYVTKSNEEITKRFYLANISIGRGSFNTTSTLSERIYLSEITDPNFQDYINTGINVIVPQINDAIQTYILGANNQDIEEENQIVNTLNQAISDFGAISNPSTSDIDTLNQLISDYNAYAVLRNNSISLYNTAVNSYNATVGIPNINGDLITYPSGTLNHEIEDFNSKFKGLGFLEPLPFFQNLSEREYLPEPLPMADPDFNLTSLLASHLTTPISETFSPYSAYRILNEELNQNFNSTFFGMTGNLNDFISYYNQNYVMLDPTGQNPISPTEQKAISNLNQAIQDYNDPSSGKFLKTNLLTNSINEYDSAININPNLNNAILQFNEEIIGVGSNISEGFNNTIGVGLNLGINDVNSLLPSNMSYPSYILMAQAQMPSNPSDLNLLTQINFQPTVVNLGPPLIADRTFRPILLPNTVSINDIPSIYDPFLNDDGTININQFPSVLNIPTIPVVNFPDPFANINQYFDDLNVLITNYDTSVGDLVSPTPSTENDTVNQLNQAIHQWNLLTTRTASDVATLQNAIDNYNLFAYGGSGFSALTPAPGSFNAIINDLNSQVNYFNTSADSPPAETLLNLNNEISIENIARNLFGLPLIPLYEAKPLRELMQEAPVIPPNSDPNTLPSYSELSKREPYSPIFNMSNFIIEANYLFQNNITLNGKVKDTLSTTISQLTDPNFLAYQSLVEGVGSIPDVYNQALNDYFSASQLDPGNMPAIAISGSDVLLDPVTQNAVTNDLLEALNQIPPLSSIDLQQKIDAYNNYSSLVNSYAISNVNSIISNLQLNQIGIKDPITGEYPIGTLNAYATSFQNLFKGNGLIGPLKILNLDTIAEMPSNLPPVSTLVTINNQSEPLYSLASLLNTSMENVIPTSGNPSLTDLNDLISSYNSQVGDISGIEPDTENGIIFMLNQTMLNAFPSDVSSNTPSSDPNIYFSALDNLNDAAQNFNSESNILNVGGTLGVSSVLGVDVLNNTINLFNLNTLPLINSSTQSLLDDINNTIQSYGFSPFQILSQLSSRETMPGPYTNITQALIPNELQAISTRNIYPQIIQKFSFVSRPFPTYLPEFFSINGSTSDLANLNNNVYLPLIESIKDYNESLDPQIGLYAENQAIIELNSAITSFNEGSFTSDELKEAVSTYIQKISTDIPSINSGIHDLNDLIKDYQTQFNAANSSLEFWGLFKLPQEFMINQRRVMPGPPIPGNNGLFETSNYQTQITTLALRNPQNYPHILNTVSDPVTKELSVIFEPISLHQGALITTVAKDIFDKQASFKKKGYKLLENSLKRIELFDELQEFLRGKRIEFPNAYIEYGVTPLSPAALSPLISTAVLSIGLTSNHFESLLLNESFIQLEKHFELKDLGFLRLFQTLAFEINNKIVSKSFGSALLQLNNNVPFLSLNAFRNPDLTPIAPIVTGSVLQQIVGFIRARVTEEIVEDILSPKAPKALVEAVSSAFNLSLVSNGLVLVGNILGKNIPKTLIELNGNPLKINTVINDNTLNKRIKEENLKDTFVQARKEQLNGKIDSNEVNKMHAISQDIINQRNISDRLINSINQQDALQYLKRKEAIKNELINKTSFSEVHITKNLQARSLQESLLKDERLKNIDAQDLSNRIIKKIIEKESVLKEINHQELLHSLLNHKIILNNEESQAHNQALIAETQRRFDRQQTPDVKPIETLTFIVQTLFGISIQQAEGVTKGANILVESSLQSELDNLDAKLSEPELRNLINQRIDEKLNHFDEKVKQQTKDIINENLLNNSLSLKNLLIDYLKRLQSLNDDKLNEVLYQEFRDKFATQEKLYVFLQKLQDPLYFGIYCIGAGLMYDQPQKGNYRRDIEIHI